MFRRPARSRPATSPRSRTVTLVALGALSGFGPLSLDLYLPALPGIAGELHGTDSQGQLTMSACMVGLAAGQLLAGPISDRLGRRVPLLTGVTAWAVASLLCALAPTVEVLVAVRLVQGVGGAAGLAISRAIVRDRFADHEIAGVFSMLILVSGIAPVVAPLAGSQLLGVTGWRGLFVLLALIGAALVATAWWALPESLPPERRHAGGLRRTAQGIREVTGDRLFDGACAVMALAGVALFTYIPLSTFVLQHQYGLSPAWFGVVFASNSVGIMLAGRVTALLVRRFPPAPVLGGALLLLTGGAAVALAATLAGAGLAGLLVPLWLAVASLGGILPTATALALLHHRRNAGTASALLGTSQFLAGSLVAPVASIGGATAVKLTGTMLPAGLAALLVFVLVIRQPAQENAFSGTQREFT